MKISLEKLAGKMNDRDCLNWLIFIWSVLLYFDVDILVPDTVATTLSEFSIFEYLEPLLKKKRLIPKSIASTKAIFDFPKVLNIFILYVVSIIIASINKTK